LKLSLKNLIFYMKTVITHGISLLYKKAVWLVLFCAPLLWAQGFTLTVTATNESCPGNGALTFAVANAQLSPVNFKVYLLPNTTTPMSDNANTSLSGLQDGNYMVVATQSVGGTTVTDTAQATIQDVTTPLIYSDVFPTTPAFCHDGVITVATSSGTPVSYQITAGPQTAPSQASPTFTGLDPGLYTFKATDACGTAIVTSYLLGSTAPLPVVQAATFSTILPNCTQITVSNELIDSTSPITHLYYPITAVITVYPPGGGTPLVYTQTFTSGQSDRVATAATIPLYYGQAYNYDVSFTDPCGYVYTLTNNIVPSQFSAAGSMIDLECGDKALTITPSIYVPPYTITFTQWPTGFNPADYPSSYSGDAVFGDIDNPSPYGQYAFTAVDACGRTATGSYNHTPPLLPIVPQTAAVNMDCATNLGIITASIPERIMDTAILTDAPAGYTGSYDFSNLINNDGELLLGNMPMGTYVFTFTDTCGDLYTQITVIVPAYVATAINPIGRADCTDGLGSVSISGGLTSVIITSPAPGYTGPLDVSQYIAFNGTFSMDAMPPGTYTFEISNACTTQTKTINLGAYSTSVNNITMTPHCGAFDVSVFHTTTGTAGLAFWLQREIAPGVYAHPSTGELFNGTYSTATALQLTNNFVTTTLIYPEGHYRVVKTFVAFANGNVAGIKICQEQVAEFDYTNGVQVVGIQSLTCTGIVGDVQVNAVGVQPLTYTLYTDAGQLVASNGNSNAFLGLNSATYTVFVSSPCGDTSTYSFNVAEIPSLVNAASAPDIAVCDAGNDGIETFNLATQDSTILNGQDPADVTLTYHSSYNDADLGINPLPLTLNSGNTTIHARVQYGANNSCYALTSFNLVLNQSVPLQMPDNWYGCEGSDITLTADAGYTQYFWSNGSLTQQTTVTQAGEYSVIAYNAQGCLAEKTVHVFTTAIPVINTIDTIDWSEANNVITVFTEPTQASVENFEYSLDGVTYQESNVFTGLTPGSYTVYVRDTYGCGLAQGTAYLLTYPKFFTPNKDGINETWRISFSSMAEPGLMVYIYDRYGKLVTGFDADSIGWDGTLTGKDLPSTDYWFVVRRQNGKEHRGHFSMIR
jgi:gliding motility-associated-like protein